MAPVGGCLALNDDLLHIFASYLDDTADLRCAATCRRWRRLVASEAGFIICRRKPPSEDDRLVNVHGVGFFHQRHDYYDSSPRLQFLPPRYSSLDAVFDGDLIRNSRLMASRNGRLLLELRCGPRDDDDDSLRLAVCNAITSRVFVLPTLPDMPEHYACALLAAVDLDGAAVHPLLRPGSAAYRVIVIYTRGGAMACRSCSSDSNASWGPEGQVSHANIRSRQLLGEMGAGVAVGGSVFWLSGNRVVFGLRLDTLRGRVESPKWYGMHRFCFGHPYPDRRLVVLPGGRLGAVQVGRGDAGNLVMNVFARNDYEKKGHWLSRRRERRWDWESVDLDALLPPWPAVVSGAVKRIRLRAVCERSGLIFLAAMHGDGGKQQDMVLYALDLEKKKVQVQLVPSVRPESCCFSPTRRSSCSFQGCDNMDLVAYLTSLGT